jgi:SH3 domain protein
LKSIKLLIFALFFPVTSFAATQYVSDQLSIFMHSGPSLKYRIIGSIEVGTAVNTLEYNSETKFSRVKLNDGQIGWVKSAEIQTEPPAKSLLPEVQQKLQESQSELDKLNGTGEYEGEINDKDNIIAQLDSEKRVLSEKIADLEARNMELDLLQSTKDERIKMEWLMYGGSVLVFGMLVGIIIPFLPRRRKRSDSW